MSGRTHNPIRLALAVGALALLPACSAPPAEAAPQEAIVRRAINPSTRFSEAHQVGNTYYFSGKLGITEETRAMTEGRIQAETRNVMEKFKTAFEAEGLTLADAVRAEVYLTDLTDFSGMNEVYATYFSSDPPARVTVGANLVAGAAIEIAFIAVKR